MVVKTPKFQIGDRIYHVTKESEQGGIGGFKIKK